LEFSLVKGAVMKLRWLKIALVAWVVFDFLTPGVDLGFFYANSHAKAATITPFNPQQLQIPATGADFNALVNAINAILSPLTGGGLINGGAVGVNIISLIPGATGVPAQIGLQPGSDPNGSIQIVPNGSGDIILFNQANSGGFLVFGSQSLWVPATGLSPCPAMQGGTIPLGMTGLPVVTGYWVFEDWLDRVHYAPACG
jgi:hypothetical protein